jgi:hypothetical protein
VTLDPRTLHPLGRIRVRGEPDGIRVAGARVWVATTTGPSLVELDGDPSHPRVLHRRSLGRAPALLDAANVDLAIVGDRFWISSPAADRVFSGEL